MRLTPLAILFAALACATPGAAQTATGRARLRAFDDSLVRVTSPAALAPFRSAIESVPGRSADPEYQLRLGSILSVPFFWPESAWIPVPEDTMTRLRFDGDAEMLAEWRRASSVVRTPRTAQEPVSEEVKPAA